MCLFVFLISLRRLHCLSFCLLRRNIPIVSFNFGRLLSAYSQLNQKEQEMGDHIFLTSHIHDLPWDYYNWHLCGAIALVICSRLPFWRNRLWLLRRLQFLRELWLQQKSKMFCCPKTFLWERAMQQRVLSHGWYRQCQLCVSVWWPWKSAAATEANPAELTRRPVTSPAGEAAACPQTHSLTQNLCYLTHSRNLLLGDQGSNLPSGSFLGVTRSDSTFVSWSLSSWNDLRPATFILLSLDG